MYEKVIMCIIGCGRERERVGGGNV